MPSHPQQILLSTQRKKKFFSLLNNRLIGLAKIVWAGEDSELLSRLVEIFKYNEHNLISYGCSESKHDPRS